MFLFFVKGFVATVVFIQQEVVQKRSREVGERHRQRSFGSRTVDDYCETYPKKYFFYIPQYEIHIVVMLGHCLPKVVYLFNLTMYGIYTSIFHSTPIVAISL